MSSTRKHPNLCSSALTRQYGKETIVHSAIANQQKSECPALEYMTGEVHASNL